MKGESKRWQIWEGVGLLVLLCIRLGALRSYEQSGWAAHPMVDASVYWQQARELAEGGSPFSDGFYQPPGYPWLLSQLIEVTGEASLQSVRWLQLALGMFNCGAMMSLGRRLGSPRGAPWLGVLAGMLFGLYPSAILFEHDLLTPTVSTSLFLGSLLLLWPRKSPSVSTVLAGMAGVLLGFTVVVHPTYLLAALLLLGAVGVAGRSQGRLGPTLALATGMGLTLLPTSHQNYEKFGQFQLVSHNAGLNFYLGNGRDWESTQSLEAGLPFRRLVLDAEPHQRNVAERNAYWWSRTWGEIGQDPLGWMDALATKAVWSVNQAELPRNEDYRCRTEQGDALSWVSILPVRFGWVFGLACLGAWSVRKQRGRPRLGVGLWVALHAPMILFLVADRYRLAAWPVVVLLACLGSRELVLLWKRRGSGSRPGWKSSCGLLVCMALPWVPIGGASELDPADCRYQDGHLALMQAGEWEEFVSILRGEVRGLEQSLQPMEREAARLRARPTSSASSISELRVQIESVQGIIEEAEAQIGRVNGQAEERYEVAIGHYREVLTLQPGHMSAHFWLAEVLRRVSRHEEAAEHLELVVTWFPQHFKAQRMLGGIYLDLERHDAAIEAYEAAWRIPGDRTATGRRLIKLLLADGRREEASERMFEDHELAVERGLKAVVAAEQLPSDVTECMAIIEVDKEGVPRRAHVDTCPETIRGRVQETAMKFRFHPVVMPGTRSFTQATWKVSVPLEIR